MLDNWLAYTLGHSGLTLPVLHQAWPPLSCHAARQLTEDHRPVGSAKSVSFLKMVAEPSNDGMGNILQVPTLSGKPSLTVRE